MCTRTRAALAAVPLLFALVLSGCGSDSDDGGDVASVTGDSPSSGDASGATMSEDERHEAALEFAECMRKNGVDMEDPEPGEGLRIQVRGGNREEMDAAMDACRDLMPPPPPGAENDMKDRMLAMAECMREHGVEAFPDPEPGEGLRIGPEVAEDPDFESAQEACRNTEGGPSGENSL